MHVRKSQERGHFDHKWLNSYHSFSFADYHDPEFVQLKSLRVFNEDFVQAKTGFPPHQHREMEIVTYVISGEVEHQDNMGHHFMIKAGETQRMTAGTGIAHSETNPGKDTLHLLQIWFLPNKAKLTPEYEQKSFLGRQGLTLIGTPKDFDHVDSLKLNANVKMWSGQFNQEGEIKLPFSKESGLYLHLIAGSVQCLDIPWIGVGDALWTKKLEDAPLLKMKAGTHFVALELL